MHRFVTAYLLNVWFIITLAVEAGFHHAAQNANYTLATHFTSYTWAQVLAWAGGSALWIALSFCGWLIRGRHDLSQPFTELPGDTSRRKLTPPLIMFALLRAIVVAGTFALAFGLNLSHGAWLVVAAMIAMKASLDQSTIAAAQRLVGAVIGAAVAALLLLIPANVHGLHLFSVDRGLEVVALVLLMHGAAVRFWNYGLYCGIIAAAVLTLLDLPHPSNYSTEGYRVLWTLCGVAIGVLVMFLAGLLAKRTAKAPPQPAPQPT